MHHLLEHHLSLTFAAFFGLILASGVLVGRMCRVASTAAAVQAFVIGIIAALAAVGLVSQPAFAAGTGLGYTFFCGAIAICAMILPGVSGSYLLVLLGMYEPITGLIKSLPKGQITGADVLTLAVFAAGCLVGLITFSKFLKWLLATSWTPTMAALCGFMIGSLVKIWPFQRVDPSILPDHQTLALKEKLVAMRPYWPESFDGHTWSCVAVALTATALVLIADFVAKRSKRNAATGRPTAG